MRNMLDFSSWPALLSTVMGLLVASLLMVGIRLVFMQTIQRRRERENRQINERLKTLIAAYKTLGGSFTGHLLVSPLHMRDLRTQAPSTAMPSGSAADQPDDEEQASSTFSSSERQRRIRDAVEAALSDVILLGTEEQVQLAAQAAQDMVAGRHIETAQLVVSLRQFIRAALDLEPISAALPIPHQGPVRPSSSGAAGKRNTTERGDPAGGGRTGGGGGTGGQAGGAMAMGVGAHHVAGDTTEENTR